MPIYEYDCDSCGLRFDKLKSIKGDSDTEPCPDCHSTARKIISVSNFSFAHTPVGGPRPQNTGVHSIDYNADRVIGRDSAERWKIIAARQDQKRKVIRDNPGSTGFDLTKTHDGEYKVMKPEERKAAEKGRAVEKLIAKDKK